MDHVHGSQCKKLKNKQKSGISSDFVNIEQLDNIKQTNKDKCEFPTMLTPREREKVADLHLLLLELMNPEQKNAVWRLLVSV